MNEGIEEGHSSDEMFNIVVNGLNGILMECDGTYIPSKVVNLGK